MASWRPGDAFLPLSAGAPRVFPPGQLIFVPKSKWVPDSQSKHCFCCPKGSKKSKFGFSNSRHHCRLCGQVVCGSCSDRRHPKYQETRICRPCYSMIMRSGGDLFSAGWYHGPLTREVAEQRLLAASTMIGDFLVRESNSVDGTIACSVKAGKSVLHYLIKEKFGHFFMGKEPTQAAQGNMYPTIQALITENRATYNLLRAMIIPSWEGDTCPQCAANIDGEMEFCEECGTRLRSTAEQMQIYDDEGAKGMDAYDDDTGAGGDYEDDQGAAVAALGGTYDDEIIAGMSTDIAGMGMGYPPGGGAQQQQQLGYGGGGGAAIAAAPAAATPAAFCPSCGTAHAGGNFCAACGHKMI